MRTTLLLSSSQSDQSEVFSLLRLMRFIGWSAPLYLMVSRPPYSSATMPETCCCGTKMPNCVRLSLHSTLPCVGVHEEHGYLHARICRCRKRLSSRMTVECGRRRGTSLGLSVAASSTCSSRNSLLGSTTVCAVPGLFSRHS